MALSNEAISSSSTALANSNARHFSMPLDTVCLRRLRKDMFHFALRQLNDRHSAEDVVQEALAAALVAQSGFEHRSAVKTWVFTILKNKIVDVIRDKGRVNQIHLGNSIYEEAGFDVQPTQNGGWCRSEMLANWGNPEYALESQQFWCVLDNCMADLPEKAARVFAMREIAGLEVAEICSELGIKESNCWVILHRAKMILRIYVQERWFEEQNRVRH